MRFTRLNVAGVTSIILFMALFAWLAVGEVSDGGTTARIGMNITLLLLLTTIAVMDVFAKLGPHPPSYHGIAQWTFLSVLGVYAAMSIGVYFQERRVLTLLSAVCITVGWGLCALSTFMERAATHSTSSDPSAAQVQPKLFLQHCTRMWILFAYVAFWWFVDVIVFFPNFNLETTIFGLLTVSCWFVASTPSATQDEAEVFAQQEEIMT